MLDRTSTRPQQGAFEILAQGVIQDFLPPAPHNDGEHIDFRGSTTASTTYRLLSLRFHPRNPLCAADTPASFLVFGLSQSLNRRVMSNTAGRLIDRPYVLLRVRGYSR